MPIGHCGSSGILKGFAQRFYKFIIARSDFRVAAGVTSGSNVRAGALPKIQSRNDAKKKAAFTLAEVLITLGIIGIVAAMTLPTLIADYQKKVLETQYKKGVAVLSNGIQMIMAKNETPGDLQWPCSRWFTLAMIIIVIPQSLERYLL